MPSLTEAISAVLAEEPSRVLLSAPRKGSALRRATATHRQGGWQLERLTATQAFHENVDDGSLCPLLCALLQSDFTQLTAFTEAAELRLRITKKGGVLTSRSQRTAGHPQKPGSAGPLLEGSAIPALVDIGIMAEDGHVLAKRRDKFRQIARFVELVDEALRHAAPRHLNVVDFGCGRSSLTFVLYHYFTALRGIDTHMTGIDQKADIIENGNAAARRYRYDGLRFVAGDVAGYVPDEPVDIVVALHACDTATDIALLRAVQWGAGWVFSVPCCQHEAAAQISAPALPLVTRYGIVRERTAALFTDAIRANLLTACGYKTRLIELTDQAATPKNIMIRAEKVGMPLAERRRALAEVRALCEAFSLSPCLLRLLSEAGLLEEAEPAR